MHSVLELEDRRRHDDLLFERSPQREQLRLLLEDLVEVSFVALVCAKTSVPLSVRHLTPNRGEARKAILNGFAPCTRPIQEKFERNEKLRNYFDRELNTKWTRRLVSSRQRTRCIRWYSFSIRIGQFEEQTKTSSGSWERFFCPKPEWNLSADLHSTKKCNRRLNVGVLQRCASVSLRYQNKHKWCNSFRERKWDLVTRAKVTQQANVKSKLFAICILKREHLFEQGFESLDATAIVKQLKRLNLAWTPCLRQQLLDDKYWWLTSHLQFASSSPRNSNRSLELAEAHVLRRHVSALNYSQPSLKWRMTSFIIAALDADGRWILRPTNWAARKLSMPEHVITAHEAAHYFTFSTMAPALFFVSSACVDGFVGKRLLWYSRWVCLRVPHCLLIIRTSQIFVTTSWLIAYCCIHKRLRSLAKFCTFSLIFSSSSLRKKCWSLSTFGAFFPRLFQRTITNFSHN